MAGAAAAINGGISVILGRLRPRSMSGRADHSGGRWISTGVSHYRCAQVLMGGGHIALAYLSGSGDLRSFAIVNCLGNTLGLAAVLALAHWAGFYGAAYGVHCCPSYPV